MAEALTKLLLGAETAEIIVLRGAGEDFCIGRSTAGRRPASNSADALERRFGSDVVFDCYNAFRRVRAPVIGVVRGRALGFGLAEHAFRELGGGGGGFGGGGGINITITGNTISSQLDVRNIAQAVSAEIVRTLRLNQRVAI